MGEGISSVLTFAVGVAISPIPMIAVILMLFSRRARINGPVFLLGWIIALAIVSAVVYLAADKGDVASSSAASDTVSWGKIVLGVLLLLLAVRSVRNRPAPGTEPPAPKWMAGIDSVPPGKALGLGLLLAGANPKNLILTAGAAVGVAQLGLSSTDAIVSFFVFVVLGSLTIAGPVIYYLVGGESARTHLDALKSWLTVHNAAVMTVLFLVLGVELIAKGIPSLTG